MFTLQVATTHHPSLLYPDSHKPHFHSIIDSEEQGGGQRRSVKVDPCEINHLGSSLIDFEYLDLKSGALLSESQECLPVEIQKSISDDPR